MNHTSMHPHATLHPLHEVDAFSRNLGLFTMTPEFALFCTSIPLCPSAPRHMRPSWPLLLYMPKFAVGRVFLTCHCSNPPFILPRPFTLAARLQRSVELFVDSEAPCMYAWIHFRISADVVQGGFRVFGPSLGWGSGLRFRVVIDIRVSNGLQKLHNHDESRWRHSCVWIDLTRSVSWDQREMDRGAHLNLGPRSHTSARAPDAQPCMRTHAHARTRTHTCTRAHAHVQMQMTQTPG